MLWLWKITFFHGKISYKWAIFNSELLNYPEGTCSIVEGMHSVVNGEPFLHEFLSQISGQLPDPLDGNRRSPDASTEGTKQNCPTIQVFMWLVLLVDQLTIDASIIFIFYISAIELLQTRYRFRTHSWLWTIIQTSPCLAQKFLKLIPSRFYWLNWYGTSTTDDLRTFSRQPWMISISLFGSQATLEL